MTQRGKRAQRGSERLASSPDKQPGLRWPLAVDRLVDELVEVTEASGERTNRKELVTAIIATQERDGIALGKMLKRYRTMTVADALGSEDSGEHVISLARHGPGPRVRRAQ